MSHKEIVKEYTNADLTVIWKPKLCNHSGICVQMLPRVYNPKEKPWVKAENASVEELKNQIAKCPSGALSYKMKSTANKTESESVITKIEVAENGPLLVHGRIEVIDTEGRSTTKKRATAFCRCGASDNKPYCDGTHNSIGFKG